jgi:hypothetical protein
MPMQETPPTKPKQGATFLKNEEVGYRYDHFVIIWKTSPQIVENANFLTDLVQQISGTVKLLLPEIKNTVKTGMVVQ